MKYIILSLLLISMVIYNVSAQDCNCSESFDWMVNIVENNDAGFQYVIDKKGIEDYKKFTTIQKEKAKSALALNDCQAVMSDWLKFFRSGHIGIYAKETNLISNVTEIKKTNDEIRLQYKNEKTIDLTEKKLITILTKKKKKNPVEGIWSSGNYEVGIIGVEKSVNKFSAFIIRADSVYWTPKQVKAELILNNDGKTFAVDYLMRDHSKQQTQAFFINDSCSILNMNNTNWERKFPKPSPSKMDELYLSFLKSTSPFIEKLSTKTLYLRIPSFEMPQKKMIDSLLQKNHDFICSTPNLIIDMRNGTGGSDASYHEILPYLYTNPIRRLGGVIYSTELNAQAFEGYSKLYSDTSTINEINKIVARMRANPGKYVSIWDKPFEVDTLENIFPYPKKVAIICNHNNGSADEQFLITAKQSQKVKVFGHPTGGMLDISNVNEIDSPDGKFTLAYSMSRSYRIPYYCIDGVGIQPDYYIDEAIPEYDWVEYTMSILEN